MAFLGAIFFGFVPAFLFAAFLYWLDRYEKEPLPLLVAVFGWGFIVAAGGAFIVNTVLGVGVYMFTGSEVTTDLTTGSLIAPIVEETLKGLAVFIVFLFFRKEFDSILDGMIYAGIVALGFAATENAFYIFDRGYAASGWGGFWFLVFVRVVLVGWQHPFYTAFTGIGFAIARMSKNAPAKFLAPLAGLTMAIITHSFHNTLASFAQGLGGLAFGTFLDWSGWFIMLIFVVWMIRREGNLLPKHLQEEVAAGRITHSQLRVAASPFGASVASLSALTGGRFKATTRFYQVLGELAHKKEQFSLHGDEGGNVAIIEKLQNEMTTLSSQVSA
jgi:RsiW-degrading membrane proteinase PrsW (M82 family)